MGVDQLELLGLGHRSAIAAARSNSVARVAERPRRREPGEEPRRALEQRRDRGRERARRQRVELGPTSPDGLS